MFPKCFSPVRDVGDLEAETEFLGSISRIAVREQVHRNKNELTKIFKSPKYCDKPDSSM